METREHTWEKYFYNDKQVGQIRNDNLVYCTIRTQAHYFKKYDGFSVSRGIIDDLKKRGTQKLQIIYLKEDGTKEIWQSGLRHFEEKCELWYNGSDCQHVMSRQYWYKRDSSGREID